ncbi:MAG: thioredoxin family protein [Micromonosporaceae bacterium]
MGEDTFAEAVTSTRAPVLVDLTASWSPRCRLVSPTLNRIARERPGAVKLVRVDVEAAPGLARRLAVEVVPTLLVLRDGEEVARRAGAASAAHLRRWIGQTLAALEQVEARGPAAKPVPV